MGHRDSRNYYENKYNPHSDKSSHKKDYQSKSDSNDKSMSRKHSGAHQEKTNKYDEKGIKREQFRLHNEDELWNLPWDEFNHDINTIVKLQGVFENEDPKTREERRKKNRRGKDDKDGKDSNSGKDVKDGKDSKEGKNSNGGEGSKDGKNSNGGGDSKDGKDSNDSKGGQGGQDGKNDKDGKEKKHEGPKEKQVAFRVHIYEDGTGYNGVVKALHLKQQKYIESYNLVYFEWLSNSRLLAVFRLEDNACMALSDDDKKDDKEDESKCCKCCKCGKCCKCYECSKCKKDKCKKDKKDSKRKEKKNRTPEYLTLTAITRMYDQVEPQVHIYTPGVDGMDIKWGGHLLNGEISSAYKDHECYAGKSDEDDDAKMLYSVKN